MSNDFRQRSGLHRPGGLLAPCTIVFFSGFCIMLIELVASQLVSGYIGRSLETWTAVIGVILAGITAGNYVGGILADKYRSKPLAATLFILAGILSLSILFLVDPVGKAASGFGSDPSSNLKRILTVTFGVFFLPATVLGMISPAIVKWALDFGLATGATVGTIYAWNTVGSILGTFVTGYYLVGWFDVQTIVMVASAGLLLAGLAFLPSILYGVQGLTPADNMARTRVSAENNRSEWQREGLVIPSAIVFASGFCVMLVEVAAGRLVAGHIGQSIYTWTSVIGVILAGITIGNYCGGRLADRFDAKGLVGSLLVIASMMVVTLLFSHLVIPNANERWPTPAIGWGMRVAIVCTAAFLLPSIALGTISPAVAKWALERRYASGQTVGTIYAWNTIGSICGTFATGFYLISAFYVSRLIAFASLGLALLGMLFLLTGGTLIARLTGTIWTLLLLVVTAFVCVPANRFENTVLAFPKPQLGPIGRKRALEIEEQLHFVRESYDSLKKKCDAKTAPAPLRDETLWSMLDAKKKPLVEGALAELEEQIWSAPGMELRAKIKEVSATPELAPSKSKSTPEQDAKAKQARATLQSLQTQLDDLAEKRPAEIAFDSNRFESAIHQFRRGLRVLLAAAKSDGEAATDLVKPDIDDMQSRMGELLGIYTSRERSWLRFAAKLFGRNEEINLDDQYDPTDLLQYYDESNYYTLQVSEKSEESKRLNDYELDDEGNPKTTADGKKVLRERKFRQLVLDALIHGYVDLSDYGYLHYEYEHIYASVSHRLMTGHRKAGQDLRVLFLGGGSYTFPRYLTTIYPEKGANKVIACDIAEIDPRVTATVRKSLGMNQLKGKRVFLLTDKAPPDEPPVIAGELPHDIVPSLWHGLTTLITGAARRTATARETHEKYIRTLTEAGAIHVRSLEVDGDKKVDYLLDLRLDSQVENKDLQQATKSKVKVIAPTEFHELLDTSPFDNIVTHHMDARQFIMRSAQKGVYDVIYGDAFNDFSVPAHLTTLEFNQKMAELLKDDGIFMANVIDKWQVSKFMGAYMNTLEQVFKHVYLLKDRRGDPGKSRDTFVIICSQKAVDLEKLGEREEDVQGLVGTVMSPRLMKPVRRGGLFPVRRFGVLPTADLEFPGDGKETTFDLGIPVGEAAIRLVHKLDPSEYSMLKPNSKPTEQKIVLAEPLPKGAKLVAHLTLPTREITLDGDDDTWSRTIPFYEVKVEFKPPEAEAAAHASGYSLDWKLDNSEKIELSFLERAKTEVAKPQAKTKSAKETKVVVKSPVDDRGRCAPSYMSDVTIRLAVDPAKVEFTGDGKQQVFSLPQPKLEVVWSRLLDDRDLATTEKPESPDKAKENAEQAQTVAWKGPAYEIRDGKSLVFKEPPPSGYTVRVKRFTTEKILLTDRYCPVDIMLAEVAATRQRDDDE